MTQLCNECRKKPKYKNRGKCYDCAYAHQTKLRKANGTYIQKYDADKYAKSDKTKHRARVAVKNAIRDGRLNPPPELCPLCGCSGRIEAHHEDHLKPLEITWLCSKCHGKEHRHG